MTTDQPTPSRRTGLRDEIAAAFRYRPGTERPGDGTPGEIADRVLAVLYREWPWLRAEAETAVAGSAPATDQAAPAEGPDLEHSPVRCPLCPHKLMLHTPTGARAHFEHVHPEQQITGPGPWPMLVDQAALADDLRYTLADHGPRHAHERPGVWDTSGKPCGHCTRLAVARRNLAAHDAGPGAVLPASDDRAAFVPPSAEGLPPGVLDSATSGASALDAWARDPRGRNFLAHALVQLARDGWLHTEPGEGFEAVRDREAAEPQDPDALPTPVGRAAVLAEVERVIRTEIRECGYPLDAGCDYCNGVTTVLDKVRRLADETPQPETRPRRGDEVEAWLKVQRDEHGWQGSNTQPLWDVLDNLLDRYRLHADTGTPLDAHVCEGRMVGDCDCHLAAPAVAQPETCTNCHGSGLDPRYSTGEFACPDCPPAVAQPDEEA